jgi:hypothetical protein
MTSLRPGSVRGPLIRQWSQEVVDLAVERLDLAVVRLAALPGRFSHAEEPLALEEPSGVLRGFGVARWSSSSQGRSTNSTNRADSQSTAHTGGGNRKLGAEATRYSS